MSRAVDPPEEATSDLAGYVPHRILRRLTDAPAPLTSVESSRFQAAVLFSDIAGFTPLCESLIDRGPTGVDQLSEFLNGFFGKITALVGEHGGEVIGFSGDAPIVLFPGDRLESDPAVLARRAGQCALELQREFADYRAVGEFPIRMRVGVGVGRSLFTTLGGLDQRWWFLLAGEPLDQIAATTHLAQPGQVMMSLYAAELLGADAEGYSVSGEAFHLEGIASPLRPTPLPRPEASDRLDASLRSFVARSVLSKIDAGQREWMAELRRVTVAFLQIEGIRYDAPTGNPKADSDEAVEQAQAAFLVVQKCVDNHGGSLNQIVVDDKGTNVLLAWGLPATSHRNDAARALKASLDLHAELTEQGLRVHIGVATGRVFCGERGDARRRDYAVIGNTVNRSARLMGVAAGNVLCDEETQKHSSHSEDLLHAELPGFILKGSEQPVSVFRASKRQSGLRSEPLRVVGRASEIGRICEFLDSLEAAAPARDRPTLIVQAEAGMGKSALLREALTTASTRGLRILTISGNEKGAATPYSAWGAVFASLLGLEAGSDSQRDTVDQLIARVKRDPERAPLAPLLSDVFPIALPDNAFTSALTGELRATKTLDLLTWILCESFGSSSTILVVEDAHWLSSTSWKFIFRLSQSELPLLLLIATRPMDGKLLEGLDDFREEAHATTLFVEPLDLECTGQLLADRLCVPALTPDLRAFAYRRTEGHPFFIEELAYALRDEKQVIVRGGTCGWIKGEGEIADMVPESIEGVLISRIDRLPARQQLALKVASVIGRDFDLATLRSVHPVRQDHEELTSLLTELGLTRLVQHDPIRETYHFTHVITRDVTYNLLPSQQRSHLHRATAEHLEKTAGDEVATQLGHLAHHWLRASELLPDDEECRKRAIEFLVLAGDQSARAQAGREVIHFLSAAIRLDADEPTRETPLLEHVRRQRVLASALHDFGEQANAIEIYEGALKAMGQPMPQSPASTGAAIAGALGRQVLHRLLPARLVRRRKEEARLRQAEMARLFDHVSICYHGIDRTDLAGLSVFSALNAAERAGSANELARNFANVGGAASALGGLPAVSDRYFQTAFEAANSATSEVESYVLGTYVLCNTFAARLDLAEVANARSIDLAEKYGYQRGWEWAMQMHALITYFRGDLGRARELAGRVEKSAEDRGDPQCLALALAMEACLDLHQGQHNRAIQKAVLAKEHASEHHHAERLAAGGVLSLAFLRAGKRTEAFDEAVRTSELGGSMHSSAIEGIGCVAEVFLDLLEAQDTTSASREDLDSRAEAACHMLAVTSRRTRLAAPRSNLMTGRLEALRGRPKRARRSWRRSLKTGEKLKLPFELARCQYGIARALPADDPNRSQYLEQAISHFSGGEAGYYLDAARMLSKAHTGP